MTVVSLSFGESDVDQTDERKRGGGNKMELRLFRVAVSNDEDGDLSLTTAIHQGEICQRDRVVCLSWPQA